MQQLNDILPILGALGVGSAITVVLQHFLGLKTERRKKIYDERKEAYVGLIESWQRQDTTGITEETMRDVGHWVLRVEFVGSDKVHKLLQEWNHIDPGSPKRPEITSQLKAAMRDDLCKV